MEDSFPITVAQTVALFLESIFYGIYLVTLGHCSRTLLFESDRFVLKRRKEIKWIMVTAALLMAIVATLNVSFILRHILNAFIYYKGPGGATAELSDIGNWVNVMQTADYVAQTAIGDSVLIYRLYVIYNRRWTIVVLPIMMWMANIGPYSILIPK
ncbi:hypothetical protein EW026_g7441 [Hermanssonia centrifuga]|uniref:Uncharacterized protein n=2 Tax=Hermanssonia centrifuga TaxID=98765 RepID=A0A4S4K7T2_9APHY|nr:hypothetical protein PHLCEN_2v2657 [Hermanssonia centrifuga]THG93913.1 hypothetical protein EW026_g7441 [Hermanssonia centrifuga]